MLKDYDLALTDKILRVRCDETLIQQARWLLKILAGLDTPEQPLVDGMKVRVGWSILKLHQQADVLVVFQPDYHGDPFRQEDENLTDTLRITAEMRDFLVRVGKADKDDLPLFSEKIVMQKGAIRQPEIYLERRGRVGRDDSGWFLGLAQGLTAEAVHSTDTYEAIRVYQLVQMRPSLLKVLGLPAGCLVVFEGDVLMMAVDEHEHDLLNP